MAYNVHPVLFAEGLSAWFWSLSRKSHFMKFAEKAGFRLRLSGGPVAGLTRFQT